jgi:transposase
MTRKRRVFSDEFKEQAVRRVRERAAIGVSWAQMGRELGVPADLLRRWARAVNDSETEQAGEAAAGDEVVTLAEVRRLRREVETLRQERDFAKKAAAFFAKEVR